MKTNEEGKGFRNRADCQDEQTHQNLKRSLTENMLSKPTTFWHHNLNRVVFKRV